MRALIIALSIAATMGFAACGSNGGGGDVANPGGVVPPPTATPPMSQYDIRNCQVGQIFHPSYGCLNRNSCQAGYGWVPGQFICVPGTVVTGTGNSIGRFFGSMGAINRDTFEKALQYLGTSPIRCNYWTYNYGDAKCSSWSSAGFVFITQAGSGSEVVVSIGAGSPNPNSYNASSIYSGGSRYIGTEFFGSVQLYNNNQGIRIVGTSGMTGAPNGVTAIVNNGNLTSNSMQVQLLYQGVEFARANVERY